MGLAWQIFLGIFSLHSSLCLSRTLGIKIVNEHMTHFFHSCREYSLRPKNSFWSTNTGDRMHAENAWDKFAMSFVKNEDCRGKNQKEDRKELW